MLVEPLGIVRGRNYVTGGVAHAPGAGVGGQRSLWMAKRRRLRESEGPDGRSERPAMGRGQTRPTKDAHFLLPFCSRFQCDCAAAWPLALSEMRSREREP